MRFSWFSHLAALLLLSSCATFRPANVTTVREGPWVEVRTEHAVILANVDEQVALKMGRELERLRRALLLLWGADVNPPGQLRVLILKRRADLEYFADKNLAGYFAQDVTGPFLVLAADGGYLFGDGAAPEVVQVHELAHAVMFGVLKRQPRWLAEGLATYLENVRVDADGNVALGKVNLPAYTHVVRGGREGIAVLRSWRQNGALSPSDVADRYASSWAWVHFLFNQRPQQFVGYLQRIAAGEEDQAAWQAAFTEEDSALEQALTVYLASGHGSFVTLPLPPVSQDAVATPLPAASAHAALAQLYLTAPGPRSWAQRQALARDELKLALAADPKERIAATLDAALDGKQMFVSAHGDTAAPAAPAKPCLADIARDNAIEGESHLAPGTRVAEFGPGALGLRGDAEQMPSFTEARVTLSSGELALLLGSGGRGVKALVLRPDEPGACVLASWATALAGEVTLQRVQRWTAPDQSVAVFVIGLLHQMEGEAAEQRWITVATDGRRVWAPLKGGGGTVQLLAREAKLRPQSGKLYLDVKVKGPAATVFAFRPESGEFQQLRR